LTEPYPLDGASASVGASLGLSLFPDHGDDAEALLRNADAALYEAKRGGKGRVRVAQAQGERVREPPPQRAAS
jgi:predicted signal transduction protein with EAL and GGDEF domain